MFLVLGIFLDYNFSYKILSILKEYCLCSLMKILMMLINTFNKVYYLNEEDYRMVVVVVVEEGLFVFSLIRGNKKENNIPRHQFSIYWT